MERLRGGEGAGERGLPLRRGAFSRTKVLAVSLCLSLALSTVFFGDARAEPAPVDVIPATGGEEMEVGSSAPLTGPFVTERVPGGIGEGEISLQAPLGFEFDTTRYVTATVTNTGSCEQTEPPPDRDRSLEQYEDEQTETTSPPENRPLLLNGAESQTVLPTAGRTTVSVTQASSGECTASIEWSGISVMAVEPGSGSVTKVPGGSAVSGIVDGVTDLGPLSALAPVEPEPEPEETTTAASSEEDQDTVEPEETAADEDIQEETTGPETEPEETTDDPVEPTSPKTDETTTPAQPEETTQEPTSAQDQTTTPEGSEEQAPDTQEPEETTEDPEPEITEDAEPGEITVVELEAESEETTATRQDPESEENTVVEEEEEDDSGLTMTVSSENPLSFGEGLSSAGTGSSDSTVTAFREGSAGAYYVKDGATSRYAAVVTVESFGPWAGSVSATEAGTAGMSVGAGSLRWRLGDMSDLPAARGGTPFSTTPDSTVFDTASSCEEGSTQQAGLCTYNFDYSLRVLGSDSPGLFSSVVTYTVSPV